MLLQVGGKDLFWIEDDIAIFPFTAEYWTKTFPELPEPTKFGTTYFNYPSPDVTYSSDTSLPGLNEQISLEERDEVEK